MHNINTCKFIMVFLFVFVLFFFFFFLMLTIIHKEFIYHNITYSGKVNYSDRITLKIYACKYMYIFIVLYVVFFFVYFSPTVTFVL
jgi:hypothetical protein